MAARRPPPVLPHRLHPALHIHRRPGSSTAGVQHCARAQGVGHCAYEPGDDAAQRLAFRMLTALPAALLAADQLSLHYQPRVALASGKCVGVEALLRWRHPELGNVAPGVFIPLAEKTALMWRITQWVLNASFAQAALWQRAGYGFSLSLNVSAHDLDHAGFVDTLVALRDKHAVDPARIALEFTESAMSWTTRRTPPSCAP